MYNLIKSQIKKSNLLPDLTSGESINHISHIFCKDNLVIDYNILSVHKVVPCQLWLTEKDIVYNYMVHINIK